MPEFDADWGLETLVHVGEHWIDSLLQVSIPFYVTFMHLYLFSLVFLLLLIILRLLPGSMHGHMTHTRQECGSKAPGWPFGC